MRSWSTRRWRKDSPGFSARCPPGPDAVCRYLLTPAPNLRDPMIQTKATLIQDTLSEKSFLSSQVEAVGSELARYGLAVVVAWIGLMKFTAYEAEGIRPFVAHSPL